MDGLHGSVRQVTNATPQVTSQFEARGEKEEVGRSMEVVEGKDQQEVWNAEDAETEWPGGSGIEEVSRTVPPSPNGTLPHRTIHEMDKKTRTRRSAGGVSTRCRQENTSSRTVSNGSDSRRTCERRCERRQEEGRIDSPSGTCLQMSGAHDRF